jgi:hypothetical protein
MAIQKKPIASTSTSIPSTKISRPEGFRADRAEYDEATENPNAAVFDALASAKEFSAPDIGTYEAVLYEMKILPLGPKGQSIQAIFLLAVFDEEGNLSGQQFSRFFKVFEADGRTRNDGSMMFWAAMMAKLGYSKERRGEETFDEINKTQPAVSLKITENSNPQFPPNATVLSRLGEDNENIMALREWIESNPF